MTHETRETIHSLAGILIISTFMVAFLLWVWGLVLVVIAVLKLLPA